MEWLSEECKDCENWECRWCEIYRRPEEGSRQETTMEDIIERLNDILYHFERERTKALHTRIFDLANIYTEYIHTVDRIKEILESLV